MIWGVVVSFICLETIFADVGCQFVGIICNCQTIVVLARREDVITPEQITQYPVAAIEA